MLPFCGCDVELVLVVVCNTVLAAVFLDRDVILTILSLFGYYEAKFMFSNYIVCNLILFYYRESFDMPVLCVFVVSFRYFCGHLSALTVMIACFY